MGKESEKESTRVTESLHCTLKLTQHCKSILYCCCCASLVAQLVKKPPAMQETPVRFLGPEDPLEKGRLPTPVFLGFPGGSAGKESTHSVGDLGSILGWEDPLEKRTATHSSILAWRIPWTEEPGGLQSMGVIKSQTRLSDFQFTVVSC